MKIHLYSFSKRKNSTKQPPALGYTEIDVKWKEDTSIKSPSFVYAGDVFTYTCNYVHIPSFNKYYYVDDIIMLTNGLTQIDLREDSMATNKSAVGNTVAQIAYSSTNYDTFKVDTRLAVKTTKTISYNKDSAGIFNSTGCYILAVSNVVSNASVVTYYAMTQAQLHNFMTAVATDTNLPTAIENYCKDVWDAIISCMWVPFDYSEIPGSPGQTVTLGNNYSTNSVGKLISNPPLRASSVTLAIPWTYSDFRRTAPYTTLNAWIAGYGFTSINSSDLIQETSLKFNYMVDCMTGDCCCNIIDAVDSNIIYQSISYNLGISIPVSRYTMNSESIINNTSSFVGNASSLMTSIAANPIGIPGSIVGTLTSGTNLCLSANSRDISVKGTLGGRAIIGNGSDTILISYSMDTEDPDAADYIARWGRPVGITQAISNHSGYVQCDGASVNLAGESFERDEINSYLNSGFYYE